LHSDFQPGFQGFRGSSVKKIKITERGKLRQNNP